MAQAGSRITKTVASMLADQGGVPFSVTELAEQRGMDSSLFADLQILPRNVSVDLSERSQAMKYPVIYTYCDRVTNSLREKFRTFSGTADVVAEVRVSHDRIDELDPALHVCVDAVTAVLDGNRGNWAGGMFFAGAYEVHFGAIKHGGRNFIQSAKVKFQVSFSAE